MGCCGSSEAQCILNEGEKQSIQGLAREAVIKSALARAVPFVAKVLVAKGTPFQTLAAKICADFQPINTYSVPGEETLQIPEAMNRLVSTAVGETSRNAKSLMWPAIMNCVMGGDDTQQKQRCAEQALQKQCTQSVKTEVENMCMQHKEDIMRHANESSAAATAAAPPTQIHGRANAAATGAGGGGGRAAIPAAQHRDERGAASTHHYQGGYADGTSSNSNNNVRQSPGVPQPMNATSFGGGGAAATGGAGAGGAPDSPQHVASPSAQHVEGWMRYPLPEENGPWVHVNEAFHWSENAQLYYFPAAGHFFHPETEMWHDPNTNKWMTEEEHEKLLEVMADQGLY